MKLLSTVAVAVLMSTPVSANEFGPAMTSYLEQNIMPWLSDPVIVQAIIDQNTMTGSYDAAKIDAMDKQWRAEVGDASSAIVTPVIDNPAAEFLRARVESSSGAIQEAFIMYAQGLNVAASQPTSDMWQGDEAKFSETYGIGAGSVHVGEVEFDDSTQRYLGQISVSIEDPSTGTLIGAITIGLDAEALM